MPRLIDADALMRDIDKDLFNTESRKCYEKLRVRRQPVIDAEPVRHGRWIHDINNLYGCSECLGRETMSQKKLKPYCPNCGAKMDGRNTSSNPCDTCENHGWDMPQCRECNAENGYKWYKANRDGGAE